MITDIFAFKKITIFVLAIIFSDFTCHADDSLFQQARSLQRQGEYAQAIETYRTVLSQHADDSELNERETVVFTESLVQLMNIYQSKGEPEACISVLQELFDASPILQNLFSRDFYSVMGYALSRTEKMKEAEEATLKVFTLPLHHATPERYFRDYAYAAAVFYSNPAYQEEVVRWCEEALKQAVLCSNTSGKQWVTAMLGSVYKRNGHLNKALDLFLRSKNEAQDKNDDLGVLNSLHVLIDLFLYWDIPEYADLYASEAIRVERGMKMRNPMVSTQTYIDKGRALLQLGKTDSIYFYASKAREFCYSLPYNSGMVDVNLLTGIYLTGMDGDSLNIGIHDLQNVTSQGTAANRAKAYHQLAQVYLQCNENSKAEIMLDSLYSLLSQNDYHLLHIDYAPILEYYIGIQNKEKAERYINLLLREYKEYRGNRVNANLIDVIVGFQTEKKIREIEVSQLEEANQRLLMMTLLAISFIVIFIIVVLLFSQKIRYRRQLKKVDIKLETLVQKLNEANLENEMRAHEIEEFLSDKEKRRELETLAPHILKESGDVKFRQCFDLLFPLFMHRLREKVPTVSRREELLSMLIVLKQDNKEIAELLAVAPRSVLMLRHRFRQKIGLTTEHSLEDFIDSLLD